MFSGKVTKDQLEESTESYVHDFGLAFSMRIITAFSESRKIPPLAIQGGSPQITGCGGVFLVIKIDVSFSLFI